jgi:hypothetical protein
MAKDFVIAVFQPSLENEIKNRVWCRLFGSRTYMHIRATALKPIDHWITWFGGPVYPIIQDGFALYVERGSYFSRVVGPGTPIPYLDVHETIKAVVDLRPHVRTAVIRAWTKDGIRVGIRVRVEFQIGTSSTLRLSRGKLVYPFDSISVRKAVEYTAVRVRSAKLVESDWTEGAIGRVKGLLAHHISSHYLDELFLADESHGQMLSPTVVDALLAEANVSLEREAGVRVSNLQIIDISIHENVRRQRLETWETDKKILFIRLQGETEAFEIRVSEAARAEAQRELIVSIAESLEQTDRSHLVEPLLLSLSKILEQGLKDPLAQTYMARETLDALKLLRDML